MNLGSFLSKQSYVTSLVCLNLRGILRLGLYQRAVNVCNEGRGPKHFPYNIRHFPYAILGLLGRDGPKLANEKCQMLYGNRLGLAVVLFKLAIQGLSSDSQGL